MTKIIIGSILSVCALILTMTSCNPEDRSGEQPLKPTVLNKSHTIVGDSCLLVGEVTSSQNSSLRGCGFRYGNYGTTDTLRIEKKSVEPLMKFSVYTRSLEPGSYYAVAFAQNGVGKVFAPDSIYFTIES